MAELASSAHTSITRCAGVVTTIRRLLTEALDALSGAEHEPIRADEAAA